MFLYFASTQSIPCSWVMRSLTQQYMASVSRLFDILLRCCCCRRPSSCTMRVTASMAVPCCLVAMRVCVGWRCCGRTTTASNTVVLAPRSPQMQEAEPLKHDRFLAVILRFRVFWKRRMQRTGRAKQGGALHGRLHYCDGHDSVRERGFAAAHELCVGLCEANLVDPKGEDEKEP